MRFTIAGILSLLMPVVALGQARGEVESIGFGGLVRPGCWTPMVVRLTPTTGNIFEGRIEVVQEDLDRDNVIFTRQIVLQGNTASSGDKAQTFWMYFMPQPNRGERAVINSSTTRDELNKIIKVRLTSESGKELAKIPITQTVTLADPLGRSSARGQKVVLTVGKEHFPRFDEYQGMLGLTEDVAVVTVGDLAKGLPDDVIGYEAIDAVVWSDANPEELNLNPAQLTALQEYVRRGGRLVILQDTQPNQTLRNNKVFADLMPVTVSGVVEEKDKPTALRLLAKIDYDPATTPTNSDRYTARDTLVKAWNARGVPSDATLPASEFPVLAGDRALYLPYINKNWDKLQGPFKKATCTLKPNAVVAVIDPSDGRPYIVRGPYGAGCVTWVAQDLADKPLQGGREPTRGVFTTEGWFNVWDAVMDWPNEPVRVTQGGQATYKDLFATHVNVETGKASLQYMDLPSTSAALIGIAVLFFIVYWVAAGPGSFLVLAKKKKTHMSWFAFGVLAIAGTAMTYLIVKLVLRGEAKLQHVTYVRHVPGEPAVARTQFGLYIPRDGAQKIEVAGAAPDRTSFVTAFNVHPGFLESDTDFPAKQDYYVPVKSVVEKDKAKENLDPKIIRVPYRSTLKKLQAQWTGDLQNQGIYPTVPVSLTDDKGGVKGKLTNRTGKNLRHVYLCVHHPGNPSPVDGTPYAPVDAILYFPYWGNGQDIDFTSKIRSLDPKSGRVNEVHRAYIESDRGLNGNAKNGLPSSWTELVYSLLRSSGYTDKDVVDDDPLNPKSFPLLSFFDRVPPSKNVAGSNDRDRVDVLRRGVRHLDMSAAVSAGGMAIIAVSDTKNEPLPFPLIVDGDKVSDSAKGVVYHQFVLPVDRSTIKPVPPKPATAPGAPAAPAKSDAGGTVRPVIIRNSPDDKPRQFPLLSKKIAG